MQELEDTPKMLSSAQHRARIAQRCSGGIGQPVLALFVLKMDP